MVKLLLLLLLGCNIAIISTGARCVRRSPQETLVTTKVYGSCVTTDRRRGRCIPLATCKSMSDIFFKTPLCNRELAYLKRNQCGYQYGIIMICCPFSPSRRRSKPVRSPESLLPPPGVCGVGMSDRVIGGTRAGIDEYPWMALLIYKKNNVTIGIGCGGFLINNNFVLTAAHCVHPTDIGPDRSIAYVRLGEWDTESVEDCDEDDCSDPPLNVPIERYVMYNDYRPAGKKDDIALLKLSYPVTYTDWIKPLCLPLGSHLRNAPSQSKTMEAAGWGRKEDGRRSRFLLKVQLPVVKFDECAEIYSGLKPTQMCAGGKGVDTCVGDSGGPLMDRDTSNKARIYFYAAGIVSFGDRNCGSGRPAVYTSVAPYMEWILRNIED